MPNLAAIHDPDTLRQVAILLEKTVVSQQRTIVTLKLENARLRGEATPAQLELDLIKEQLEALKKRVFAPSSEKRPREAETKTPPSRRNGHGPKAQPLLPVSTVTHALPQGERTCPVCAGQLVPMGEQVETSEEITAVDVSYQLVTHRRQKYRCTCNAAVVTAPGPLKLIPGGRYSVEFAVHVAEAKHLDHRPLERQARAMGRKGLEIDSQTLYDQVHALARHLGPTYEALELIGALYEVEHLVPKLPRDAPDEAHLDVVALRRRLRQDRSRPIVDALREWAYATKPVTLPQSGLGKAIDYMLSLWPGLTRFLADPRVPLDNNAAERALRGLVVGRKNHYGSHSKQGAQVAAILYTLFESAKLAGVDPHAYVLETASPAIATPGTVTLPTNLS